MAGPRFHKMNTVTCHFHVRRLQRGFTMIELIVVLIVLGILVAVSIGRFFDRTGFDADTFTSQTRSILRYAQKTAVAQNRSVFVRLDGNSIALCFDSACSAANQLIAPSGANSGTSATTTYCGGSTTWYCEGRPANLAYALAPATTYFYFDAQGKPYAAADTVGNAKSSFKQLALTISGDGGAHLVTVVPETGYVY